MKHILFDLDGTLLPMNQDKFVQYYMPGLAKRFIKAGIEPEALIKAVWQGVGAMIANDGSVTNQEAFNRIFSNLVPINMEEAEKEFLDFYDHEFNDAINATEPTPVAGKIIELAKEKGFNIYLATNPIFPRCGTRNRIRWAGLSESDFLDVTTYETCHYCKPNPKYFTEIMDKHGLKAEDCLMVGNDVEEDLAVMELGAKTYIITDTLENKKNLPLTSDYSGSMKDFYEFLKGLTPQ